LIENKYVNRKLKKGGGNSVPRAPVIKAWNSKQQIMKITLRRYVTTCMLGGLERFTEEQDNHSK
jgi:hypothetical protein